MKISAIVLTGGAIDQALLKKCLESVSWADEIIKVEGDRQKGSYADWRNEGAKRARGDWLLYVDSDEQVTDGLREEILRLTNRNYELSVACYAIPRRNMIFGKEFKHSGQWPDYQKRLFLKNKLKGWKGKVHEEPLFEGSMGHLKNPLIHIKHEDLSEMVEKTNDWSEIEAELMFDAHHPPMNIARFMTAMIREFWLRLIKQAAFLDGAEGIIYGVYQVFSRFISYAKLWEMQLNARGNI